MSRLNVRSLISRFEQLTSGFQNNEPQTPIPVTPKIATKKFFPEAVIHAENKTYTKLLKIEAQISTVTDQIQLIEEVSNDDFVKILFSLLNLLIELGAIEVEGNYNDKQKKSQCFKAIIDCKESLVNCLDDEFAAEYGLNVASEESENITIVEEATPTEKNPFAPISKIKSYFESKSSEDLDQISTPTYSEQLKKAAPTKCIDAKYFGQARIENTEDQYFGLDKNSPVSPVKSTDSENSEISEPETIISREIYDRYASDKSLYESRSEIKFNSVQQMKNLFESKSSENLSKARSEPTLEKIVQSLDDSTDEEEISIDKQRAIMETLLAELDYYKLLIETMDPSDDVRAEVLEENLVEMFLELNKLVTCDDVELTKQRDVAISSVQLLQSRINENKTSIGHYITNLEEKEVNEPHLPPAGNLEAILIEVDRYKELVANFDRSHDCNGKFLEENICEVLLLLDNYEPNGDIEETARKMRAIKDLGLILNELNRKLNDENDVKHYVAVCPLSTNGEDSELVSDANFKSYIAVCPAAPVGHVPVYEYNSDINEDVQTSITQSIEQLEEDQFKDVTEDFNEKGIATSVSLLQDICVEVNIFKNILKEIGIFDEEEIEIFKNNVLELRENLENIKSFGDPEIELSRKDTLEEINVIQLKLKDGK